MGITYAIAVISPEGISPRACKAWFSEGKSRIFNFIINNLPKEANFLVRSPPTIWALGRVGKNKDLFYPEGKAGG